MYDVLDARFPEAARKRKRHSDFEESALTDNWHQLTEDLKNDWRQYVAERTLVELKNKWPRWIYPPPPYVERAAVQAVEVTEPEGDKVPSSEAARAATEDAEAPANDVDVEARTVEASNAGLEAPAAPAAEAPLMQDIIVPPPAELTDEESVDAETVSEIETVTDSWETGTMETFSERSVAGPARSSDTDTIVDFESNGETELSYFHADDVWNDLPSGDDN